MVKMSKKEEEFRKWLIGELKNNGGAMSLEEVKNSGAFLFDCSQITIGRYIKKWAYSDEIGFVVVGKTINGNWIHNVVLK